MEQGNDAANNKAEVTETEKLHRYVAQQRTRPSSVPIVPKSKPDTQNYTGVKPSFEEFLEFVLDTDLQGKLFMYSL